MRKPKEPTKWIKQRYDICVFDEFNGTPILYKKSNYRYWCADPFLAYAGDKFFCFVELMDNHVKYGQIGVIDENGKTTIAIKEEFHISFPNVFEHNGKWYMMPETAANCDLRLYAADEFQVY